MNTVKKTPLGGDCDKKIPAEGSSAILWPPTPAKSEAQLQSQLSELQIQARLFFEIWNEFPDSRYMLFHIPNGGLRSKKEAKNMKASGVIAGIPDLLFIWKTKVYGIEIKKIGGKTQKEQKKVHEIWRTNGINTYICFGYEECKKTITDIIYGRNMETCYNTGTQ